jgi:ribose/xylose/arabinose/galactoside ABC-type transport system permease subunit
MQLGRTLITLGLLLAAVGAVIVLADKLGISRLPGDFTWKRGSTTIYLPLASSIVVSVVVSLLLNLFRR